MPSHAPVRHRTTRTFTPVQCILIERRGPSEPEGLRGQISTRRPASLPNDRVGVDEVGFNRTRERTATRRPASGSRLLPRRP